MGVKIVCDFCGKPLERGEHGHITYMNKRLNTYVKFPSLCKDCADKLDTIIDRVEILTRERCMNFGKWTKINKARREQLGTKG